MNRLIVEPEAAREIVRMGEVRRETSGQIVEAPLPSTYSESFDVRPAILTSEWSENDSGLWRGKAAFITRDDGSYDSSFIFEVSCPTATEKPLGEPYEHRFWVVWRGRWEALLQPTAEGDERSYVAGTGISIEKVDVKGEYQIVNTGLRSAMITGNSTEVSNNALRFDGTFFKWDSGNNRTIQLKTRRLEVVTNVVDGVATKDNVFVLAIE